jgi:hypothetical protein
MSAGDPLAEAYAALSAFQGEVPAIPKNKEAKVPGKDGRQGYSYKYADIADVLAVALPVLAKHGLALAQSVEITQNGGLVVCTRILHRGGGVIDAGRMPAGQAGAAMQQIGGNLTYARRYAACVALGVASDEDADIGAAYDDRRPEPSLPRRAPPAPPPVRQPPRRPPPPPREDPLPQERDERPGEPQVPGEPEIVLTTEQRADEDAYLMDLDVAESKTDVEAVWKKWKPRFQETMSEAIVAAMYEHTRGALRRVMQSA